MIRPGSQPFQMFVFTVVAVVVFILFMILPLIGVALTTTLNGDMIIALFVVWTINVLICVSLIAQTKT
jgi:hypothetical protein